MTQFLEFLWLIINNTYIEILMYFFLPVLLIFGFVKSKSNCILDLLIKFLCTLSFLVLILWAPCREMSVGYYTNYIILVIFLLAATASFIRNRRLQFFKYKSMLKLSGNILAIFVSLVLTLLNINAFSAFFYTEEPLNLEFPLKNGSYMISQGGNGASSFLMNYHYNMWSSDISGDTTDKYSTDIVKLNAFGFCYNSYNLLLSSDFPSNLNNYEIYGETVYSPCDGVIFDSNDNYKDLPPSRKMSSDFGNQILIKYNENIYISLFHLKEGSITVGIGDRVKKGQAIAKVGNSGQTTMPHLHIQAYKNEGAVYKGIPILFNGSFPVKSKLYLKN